MLRPSSEFSEYVIFVCLVVSGFVAKYILSLSEDEPISKRRFLGEVTFGFVLSHAIWFGGIHYGVPYFAVVVLGIFTALGLLQTARFFIQQFNLVK